MSEKMPDLRKYTKEELINIIKAISFNSGDVFCKYRRLNNAIADLEYSRYMASIDKADKHAKKANLARKRYFEIMSPYAEQKISDIPLPTLEKARAALEESEKEEKIYLQLMKELGK